MQLENIGVMSLEFHSESLFITNPCTIVDLSLQLDEGVKCQCSICRNALCEDKRTLTMHICKFGFMPDYDVWTHHGDTIHQRIASVAEDEDDRSGDDKMDEMLDAIRPELETNREDPSTPEVQKFFLTCLELQKSRCMNTRQ
jgi:hypothetical protein